MRLEKQVGEQDYIKELSPCNLGCCTENPTNSPLQLTLFSSVLYVDLQINTWTHKYINVPYRLQSSHTGSHSQVVVPCASCHLWLSWHQTQRQQKRRQQILQLSFLCHLQKPKNLQNSSTSSFPKWKKTYLLINFLLAVCLLSYWHHHWWRNIMSWNV